MSEHDQREDYDDKPDRGRLASKEIVAWPASVMWVLGLMQCVFTQVGLVFLACMFVAEGLDAGKSFGEIWQTAFSEEAEVLTLLAWPIVTACAVLVMQGANDLRRFRRYPLVIASVVLTFLSIPFIYLGVLGIPLSIWLALLLLRRDVRARFEAVACGNIVNHSGEESNARSTDAT